MPRTPIFSSAQTALWLFLCFVIGIILGAHLVKTLPSIIAVLLALVLAFVVLRLRTRVFADYALLLLFIALGGLWYNVMNSQPDERYLKKELCYFIESESLPIAYRHNNAFYARVAPCERPAQRTRVRVNDFTRSMLYPFSYQTEATLTRQFFKNHAYYVLWVKARNQPTEIPANGFEKIFRKTSLRLLEIFKLNLNDESYRFIASVFLGRRELLTKTEKAIFTNAGIAHLLAISGSNIGIVSVSLFFVLRLFHVRYRICLAIAVLLLMCYMVLTGSSPPVVRSVIMYTTIAAGFFFKRKVNALNSLGVAGLLCALINPTWIFDASFQLSFLSIFALIVGFKLYSPRPSKYTIINYMRYLFLASLYVTIVLLPLIAFYFKRIYIISVFHNIILIPFFSVIVTISFLLIALAPFVFITQAIGAVLSLGISWFYKVAGILGTIAFTYIECKFSLAHVIIYYSLLMVIVLYFSLPRRSKISKK